MASFIEVFRRYQKARPEPNPVVALRLFPLEQGNSGIGRLRPPARLKVEPMLPLVAGSARASRLRR
jgi:hypothetical protein